MKVVVMLFCLVGALQAYTDPGTGILLWQIMLAVFAGLAFRFRNLAGKWFYKKKPPVDSPGGCKRFCVNADSFVRPLTAERTASRSPFALLIGSGVSARAAVKAARSAPVRAWP